MGYLDDNLPLGAAYDPRAPWLQEDIPSQETEVTVSITLSKTFTIEKQVDDGGNAINLHTDFIKQHYSPIEILDSLAEGKALLPPSPYNDACIRKDCEGWNVDEFEVIEE